MFINDRSFIVAKEPPKSGSDLAVLIERYRRKDKNATSKNRFSGGS